MNYPKTIQIEAFLPTSAEKKAQHIQKIVNVLEEDNLSFFAELCQKKGNSLNTNIRANQNIIREQL